ncbi:tetratricopeptide repeat protein [Echinicola marina]|uniref:tetratricopeptide repeat protein n=1 Tax=Echinicola marina TaxID=2859768 RepID=UPI001CF65942|nr:tetratricopeptide repeat protein [Echinicola marina]UCS92548.1 tetratricopeptide repeat protein [Echinicola marina]
MEKDNAISLNNQGVKHFLHQEFEQAMDCYEAAFELDPNNASLLNNLGLYHHQQQNFEKALEFFELALDQEKKPNFIINAGNSLAMMGKNEAARKRYMEAVDLDPKHANAWLSLAKLASYEGNLDDAEKYWEALLNINPQESHLIELAKTLILKKEFDKALNILYQQGNNSDSAALWFQIGRCEFQLRNHGLAEKALKKSLADFPDHPDYRYYLAINYLATGNMDEGLKHINLLLKLNPENAQILTEKGIIFCSLHQYEEALKLFEKALEIQPENRKAQHYKNLVENQTS